ncbi:hypothetical protein NEF87_001896 [Candidatus Lokiarchaeum ossiferum]|uniref:Homing endonuclease LAGLIDADG domain-containing protein n=1 Tax=Candidatus Lokiarchaeum ossiferum TaxID=2951803 RepID=A0ABY6HQ18_9ARCH|nr:hypothetical protein NEF87_001896 [Candidatus Lokiarchaeum sp. B-35]
MFLKHAPYYSMQFPRRNTTIIPQNEEEMQKIVQILSRSNISYDSSTKGRIIIKMKPIDTLLKIDHYLKENKANELFNSKLANIIKNDFKTISLLKAL